MSYLDILLICEFVIFVAVIIITNIDIVSPGVCAIIFFFIATLLLKFVEDSWKVQLSGESVFAVVIGLCMMFLAEALTIKRFTNNTNKKVIEAYEFKISVNRIFSYLFIVCSVICLVLYWIEIWRKGRSLGAYGFFAIGAVADSVNNGTLRISIVGKMAYQFVFLLAYPFGWIFASQLFDKNRRKRNWINLIPVLAAIVINFLAANRHNILRLILAIMFCCYTVARQNNRLKRKDKKKIINYSVALFSAFLLLFYIVKDIVKVSLHHISFFEYIVYYISSPIVLFSSYLENPFFVRMPSRLFGETCFTGFYTTLARWGFVREVVTETNHTVIGGVSGIRTGNTYTFFMRPYHDFGMAGIVVLTLLVFLVVCQIYHKMVYKKCRTVKAFRRKMVATIFLSYFYYMFPLAVSDFYVTIESKIMNIVYLLVMVCVCKIMFRISNVVKFQED